VARIGNSRGVRLPAEVLKRYRIEDTVLLEEQSDGLLLKPDLETTPKLSWEQTAREMARQDEGWEEWEPTAADGLDHIPWEDASSHAAEPGARYTTKPAARKR
jgi:antitoxin component of MazEF toxin-antitoxin module